MAAFGCAILVPVILLSALTLWRSAASEEAIAETRAADFSHNVAGAIEQEIAGLTSKLKALATSPALDDGDFAAFHRQAAAVGASRQFVIVLRTLDSTQIVNSRVPPGATLPRSRLDQYDQMVMRTSRPVVTDFFNGASDPRPQFAVIIPVVRSGQVVYLLSTGVPLEILAPVIRRQAADADTVVRIADRHGRSFQIGTDGAIDEVTPGIQHPDGIRREAGPDGGMIWATSRPSGTDWTVETGRPMSLFYAPIHETALQVGFGLVALTLLISGLVFLSSRYIARSVRQLATMGAALNRAEPVPDIHFRIREIDEVAQSLLNAARERAEHEEMLWTLRDQAMAAKEAAEDAVRAKTLFIAAASHDLRQPFQAMRLLQQVLATKAGPDLEPVVTQMGAALAAGEELMSAILDLSVLDAGTMKVEMASCPLASVITEVADECAAIASASSLTLRSVPSSILVRTDRVLLKRMLRNLVLNSVRYTKEGRILVGCRRRQGKAILQVLDTGIGIPEEMRKRIFEDFYQLGSPAPDGSQGVGLGLGVVSRISRLLAHPVTVSSTVGKGSVFSIEIPTVGAEPVDSAEILPERRATSSPRWRLSAAPAASASPRPG